MQTKMQPQIIRQLVGFKASARTCTCAHKSFNKQNGALRTPTPPIAAPLILPVKLMIFTVCRENPAQKIPVRKKSPKLYHIS
jgi:hypothetical protein